MEYTKGETAGGWIYAMGENGMPVALVHPKHIDSFLAAPKLYAVVNTIRCGFIYDDCAEWLQTLIDEALAKAEGK